MQINTDRKNLDDIVSNARSILLIQDIDGVCIPLVKDPLTRKLDKNYIYAVKNFKDEFYVLTCGEHEGNRGVNRIIERTLKNKIEPKKNGLYFQGLAACGVEFQENNGIINFLGISKKELNFLSNVPKLMRPKFSKIIMELFPEMEKHKIEYHISKSICETRFSPTINFNSLFDLLENDWEKKKILQNKFKLMMDEIIDQAKSVGLENSFFLHISPNLGKNNSGEILKAATIKDIGSTDIQLLLKGAEKDSGVLCLLNKFIGKKKGIYPFGENFNFRDSPKTIQEKISFCKEFINKKDMPLIIGVGDTITSQKSENGFNYTRGGSDRSFLELIQKIGHEYKIENQILFVDSSYGEVFRPSINNTGLNGISDPEDILKFDVIFKNGPMEYINWFINASKTRFKIKNN